MPVGEQAFPVSAAVPAGGSDEYAVLVLCDSLYGERDRRIRRVDDHVDAVDIEPLLAICEPISGLF